MRPKFVNESVIIWTTIAALNGMKLEIDLCVVYAISVFFLFFFKSIERRDLIGRGVVCVRVRSRNWPLLDPSNVWLLACPKIRAPVRNRRSSSTCKATQQHLQLILCLNPVISTHFDWNFDFESKILTKKTIFLTFKANFWQILTLKANFLRNFDFESKILTKKTIFWEILTFKANFWQILT